MSQVLPEWCDLWLVAERAARRTGSDPSTVFDPIGMLLEPPGRPRSSGYDATPPGAIIFGSTGGDGVHFSAVGNGGELLIVMTVPMQFDHPNVAVGASLKEFLALGCRHGYFGLEQLAYSYVQTTEEFERDPEPMASEMEEQLALLRSELSLESWPALRARLDVLQKRVPQVD